MYKYFNYLIRNQNSLFIFIVHCGNHVSALTPASSENLNG